MMDDFFDFQKWLTEIVKQANEYNIEKDIMDIPGGDEVDLNQEDFFSLLHIAVDNKDRDYFEELIERSNKI